jgi:hypothetical protein
MGTPTPQVSRGANSSAHPYPYTLGLRAQTYLTGSTFYLVLVNEAMRQYVRSVPEPYLGLKAAFESYGVSGSAWDINWKSFQAYLQAFPEPVFQNALFAMLMHWDRYIAKLGEFIVFGRSHVKCPTLTRKDEKRLRQIGFQPIHDQLSLVEAAAAGNLNLDPRVLERITELSLVRNLGMHNEWEVDQHYLGRTIQTKWQLGDTRSVEVGELIQWRDAINVAIGSTAKVTAKSFASAPDF